MKYLLFLILPAFAIGQDTIRFNGSTHYYFFDFEGREIRTQYPVVEDSTMFFIKIHKGGIEVPLRKSMVTNSGLKIKPSNIDTVITGFRFYLVTTIESTEGTPFPPLYDRDRQVYLIQGTYDARYIIEIPKGEVVSISGKRY